jgi:hypothetical protein
MFPSPLLTVSDLRIELQHFMIPEKSRAYLGISMRKTVADVKSQKACNLVAFTSPMAMEPSEARYTYLVEPGDRMTFLEPLHFLLDGSLLEMVSLQLEVFALSDLSKVTKCLSFSKNLTKARECIR